MKIYKIADLISNMAKYVSENKCPICNSPEHYIINPSNPTILKCTKCNHQWNPDNIIINETSKRNSLLQTLFENPILYGDLEDKYRDDSEIMGAWVKGIRWFLKKTRDPRDFPFKTMDDYYLYAKLTDSDWIGEWERTLVSNPTHYNRCPIPFRKLPEIFSALKTGWMKYFNMPDQYKKMPEELKNDPDILEKWRDVVRAYSNVYPDQFHFDSMEDYEKFLKLFPNVIITKIVSAPYKERDKAEEIEY